MKESETIDIVLKSLYESEDSYNSLHKFSAKVQEIEIKFPDESGGLLKGWYAMSNHNRAKFMSKIDGFEAKYPKEKGGFYQGWYAISNHQICL